jgi:ribosomal protein S18 acetylase RimI-like enzyme
MAHPLDNPVWDALTGVHAGLAERHGRAARYLLDVAPFAAVDDQADPGAWADLAELVGPGGFAVLPLIGVDDPPAGWRVTTRIVGVQLVAPEVPTAAEVDGKPLEADPLGIADLPEMLDLVARTEPGPYKRRTPELGAYLGVRRGGALIAMAGERVRTGGWTEISAVCTDLAYRGQGLAGGLVRLVMAGIRARGDIPFLHATATNTNAIRLYLNLGFTERLRPTFVAVEPVP